MIRRRTRLPLPAPDDFAVDPALTTLVEAALAVSRAPTTGIDPVDLCVPRRDLQGLRLVVGEYVEEGAS